MDTEDASPDLEISADYPELLPEIQRQLGRCVILSQRIERIAKEMLARYKLVVTGDELDKHPDVVIQRNRESLKRKSFGLLADAMFADFLQLFKPESENGDEEAGELDNDKYCFVTRLSIDAPLYNALRDGLKRVIDKRNWAVHHLLDDSDLESMEGRRTALQKLSNLRADLVHVHSLVIEVANLYQLASNAALRHVQSREFRDHYLHGIQPDASVDWGRASIASGLEEAFKVHSSNGWCCLDDAISWMSVIRSEQSPDLFGCASWPHVLEMAKFDVMKSSEGKILFRVGERREKLVSGDRQAIWEVVMEPQQVIHVEPS